MWRSIVDTDDGGSAMDLARYMVNAVVLEGRSYREVARAHGVSKSWVGKVVGRFREGGYDAIGPRFAISGCPRCPRSSGCCVDEGS
jgi:Homeodomain-like domain-containing protein